MQKTLDLSIKLHETKSLDGGYIIDNKPPYQAYMDNNKWDAFIYDMKINHNDTFNEYGAGSGGETKPSACFPPKMASYGSSSRFIYNLCKDVPDFHFEYKLPTKVGGIANLDGFIEKDDRYIFIEAKCREPYGTKNNLIENKYSELYDYITKSSCNLNIDTINVGTKMDVTFSVNSRKINHFDIKQMICHLLGMAVKFLNTPTQKKIDFVYLCYNPNLISIIDEKKKASIISTYSTMCDECNSIDFKTLFKVIVTYLNMKLNVGSATQDEISKMIFEFSFKLCDQNNFVNKLN